MLYSIQIYSINKKTATTNNTHSLNEQKLVYQDFQIQKHDKNNENCTIYIKKSIYCIVIDKYK